MFRHFDEHYVDRVRAYRETEPYHKALCKRKVWVEPLFAEAKDWHGMRKFRLRRLERVNQEALMIAAGQNVKRLLAFGDRGPRRLAQATALRPLERSPACLVRHHRVIRQGLSQQARLLHPVQNPCGIIRFAGQHYATAGADRTGEGRAPTPSRGGPVRMAR